MRSAHRPDAADEIVRALYVADASLLPTGVGINPMVTIMVLARRVARTVLAEGTGGSVSGG